jgi:hypothetical protein
MRIHRLLLLLAAASVVFVQVRGFKTNCWQEAHRERNGRTSGDSHHL